LTSDWCWTIQWLLYSKYLRSLQANEGCIKLKHGPLTSNNFQHDPKNPNSNNSKPNTMKPTFALASQAEPLFA
jgi:hypothetical protein